MDRAERSRIGSTGGSIATRPSRSRRRSRSQSSRSPGSSDEVEQVELDPRCERAHFELGLVAHTRAIAGRELPAVQLELAARDLEPGAAAGLERVLERLAALEQRAPDLRIAVDRERAVASVARGQQTRLPAPGLGGEVLLLVARLEAAALGLDPDLEEVDGPVRVGVELAVLDPRARGHALHVARADHRAGAEAVAVGERAVEHDRHDLHVAVAVPAEAGARLHAIFVDHAQRAEAHVL